MTNIDSTEAAPASRTPMKPVVATRSAPPQTMAASVPIKPRWVESAMQSTDANVCNVLDSRDEITLLFGTSQGWHNGSGDQDVKLSHHIVLTPFAAKRLAQMLALGTRDYVQRFGAITPS